MDITFDFTGSDAQRPGNVNLGQTAVKFAYLSVSKYLCARYE